MSLITAVATAVGFLALITIGAIVFRLAWGNTVIDRDAGVLLAISAAGLMGALLLWGNQ